ncbi:class IIb bacteriocin, lactobin A/cerein 7B family [Synechococcus sp. A18-25c]
MSQLSEEELESVSGGTVIATAVAVTATIAATVVTDEIIKKEEK